MAIGTKIMTVEQNGRVHVHDVNGASITIPANEFVFSVFIVGFPVAIRPYYNDGVTPTLFTFLECYAMQYGLVNTPVENDQLPVSAINRVIPLSTLIYRSINSDPNNLHL